MAPLNWNLSRGRQWDDHEGEGSWPGWGAAVTGPYREVINTEIYTGILQEAEITGRSNRKRTKGEKSGLKRK
ncbi:hypothetical protein GWI33_003601 [Rhynchophorus ferrugineus]|uniref:Uncharacterized protein n=1 Tax=Rhynchophorus ferrugineus TaxID=354439 RepID=A0A834M0G2_RHYFE|nr:hypothetical protein GWI33_003601 [Rhynchophorus ferrugineus]